ncbi:MAG: hypothetical protein WA746_23975 [Isosphaeraceae bacterium]
MVRQIIQSLIVRGGSLLPVYIFLLTGAWIAPESRVVNMLLGRSSIEKELAQVETRGYYESILDACKLLHRDPSGADRFFPSLIPGQSHTQDRRRLRSIIYLNFPAV